jgi:SRSO17 transposase
VSHAVEQIGEYIYHGAYGPRQTLLSRMGRVAATRWAIEDGLKRARGEVGLDQYEVRRWDAWHRHVTLS